LKEIKNIIFDLGGVILPIDISRTTEAYRQLGISNIDELFGHGHAGSFVKEYEKGKIDDREFIDSFKSLISEPVEDEIIINAWNALLLDFPSERIDLLKALKSRYRIFLFSNTNSIHHRAFSADYKSFSDGENFDDLFEVAWYSHIIKMRKPDVEAFHFIINDAGLIAEETIFIDDAMVNVEGAGKAGLKGIHLTGDKSILDLSL
jgi:putative hydrolase of the HAD superfamily